MGCSSSATANPFPENFCTDNDTIGMLADVDRACFFTTAIGSYCSGLFQTPFGFINGSSEWILAGPGVGCGVCSSCQGMEQGSGNGLCGYGSGSCSWGGVRMRCKRVGFNGNPLRCCRRSKAIQGPTYWCFDDQSKARTCDPGYRGFSQPSCIGLMTNFCSNDTETAYKNKWTGTPATKDCLRYVQETAGQLSFYGPVISGMVERYLITENKPITSLETDGTNHDPFITTILKLCRENAGACDTILKQKCADVNREQLSNNVNLAGLCGCFMKDSEYAKFSQFGITRECDPVCALGTSVHIYDTNSGENAKFKECNQSICVIDDVTINILAGSVTGDINFSQACSSCAGTQGTSTCRCFISDTNITAINSLIGDVSFSQQCGGTPLCYRSAEVLGAPPVQVDCITGVDTNTQTETASNRAATVRPLWIVFAVLAVILVGVFLYSITRPPEPMPPILLPGPPAVQSRPLLAGRSRGSAKKDRSLLTRP
jgi:hypothetical protein